MDKSTGKLMMVIFGVSGVAATALAWFCPSLNLDKTMATLAGFIGVSFTVFQSLRFRHYGHADAEQFSVEVATEEKQ